MTAKRLRCAIYTRKSTEEGLDKEFNTLDAQREAGEAYIKSQMHEGWQVIPTAYDDGGFTGGNMDRPALQQLMADVKAGKVQVIVVYKVDRLTRSLADFAKIVEMLDEYGVSFVSVTQQFNTSTSMGRLTLNVLLSFAQFEREVIGERVRDKLAASKQKGMWVGGHPPLGYDVRHRKLVVNEEEALQLRHMYELYLQHKSAYTVMKLINQQGYLNKRWITKKGKEMGGRPFTKSVVYRLLNDPLYIGKIQHKDRLYDGEHEAIIPQELWGQTQTLLEKQAVHKSKLRTESGTILRSKCLDGKGRAYTTSYSVKRKHSHHRYYINKHNGHRIRGDRLEKVVFDAIHYACLKPENLHECFNGEYALLSEEEGLYRLQNLWAHWEGMTEKDKHRIGQQIIDKVTILPKSVTVRVGYEALNHLLKGWKPFPDTQSETPEISHEPVVTAYDDALEISLPIIFKRTGKTSQAFDGNGKAYEVFKSTNHNMALVSALGKAHKWEQMIRYQSYTPDKIARESNLSKGYVCSILRLNLLSPKIMEDILCGRQPEALTLKQLKRPFPFDWELQKQHFSYS